MFLFATITAVVFLLLSGCWWTLVVSSPDRIIAADDDGPARETLVHGKNGKRELVFGSLTEMLSDLVPHSRKTDALLYKFLSQAGYYQSHALSEYLAVRNVLLSGWLCACLAVLVFIDFAVPISVWVLLSALVGGLVVYSAPRVWLELTAESRQQRIESALPDALDLIGMSLLGGISLRNAIWNTSRDLHSIHPDLSYELRLVHRHMDAADVQSAVSAFARRTDSDDVQSLVGMIRQTESHGTSVANSFLEFSKDLRHRARLRAESSSSKSAIKVVFPLVLCLAPSAYAVMITPALLKIKTFLDQELTPPGEVASSTDETSDDSVDAPVATNNN